MTRDWVHEAGHSSVCQILLQIVPKAVITAFHLLRPVLFGFCQLQLNSFSSVIVLQTPLLCEG